MVTGGEAHLENVSLRRFSGARNRPRIRMTPKGGLGEGPSLSRPSTTPVSFDLACEPRGPICLWPPRARGVRSWHSAHALLLSFC